MKYNLNDTKKLINFINILLNNEFLVDKAPEIIKFFIITRNYGLINQEKYINKIYNNDLFGAIIDAFTDGFKKDNIEYNKKNLIEAIIKNYDESGYYFHFFPGTYANSIKKFGILANNRTELDYKFYEIIKKYQFGTYYERSQNRICLTGAINRESTEYAIFTPEWLEIFLGSWNIDTHDIFKEGNIFEIKNIIINSSESIKKFMQENPNYKEEDFKFIINYIIKIIDNRFKDGNNLIGIALIPRKEIKKLEPTNEQYNKEELINFLTNMSDHQIINLLTNRILTPQEITIRKNIPNNLFEILVYSIQKNKTKNKNTSR